MNGREWVVLEEVHSSFDVRRNDVVVESDAVDLNCEKDGNSDPLEIASGSDGCGAAPTLTEENYASIVYFFRIESRAHV